MRNALSTQDVQGEYGNGFAGWHIERGGVPKPIGAIWLTFKRHPGSDEITHTLERAK